MTTVSASMSSGETSALFLVQTSTPSTRDVPLSAVMTLYDRQAHLCYTVQVVPVKMDEVEGRLDKQSGPW